MDKLSTNNSNSPVNELKHLLLYIDRGITNEASQQIIKITDNLSQQWQNDRVLSTFVKMVRALSDYIVSKKSNINPDIISFVKSLVIQIENLSSSSGINLSAAKRQAILAEEINKYNQIKQQLKSTSRSSDIPESSDSSDNVISEFKSIILSLDWEITDELIQKLDKEVNKLQLHWQNSKIHSSFLQMFKSIGSYVMSKGSNTHPDAISLLNSLYKNFEQIVLNPSITADKQKEILLGEMKKFNDLKQIISSTKITKPRPDLSISPAVPVPPTPAPSPKSRPAQPSSMNLMDDLIGTKSSSNLSPVDELIEEIHMLQDSGTRTHTLDSNRVAHGAGAANVNPEIKEIIPKRPKKQPISEIQTRLDAFFDEDEPLSEFSFADSGDEVVPYKGDSSTISYAPPTAITEQEMAVSNDTEDDANEISFEEEELIEDYSEDLSESSIEMEITSVKEAETPSIKMERSQVEAEVTRQPTSAKSETSTDGMVPFDFDNESFDDEIDSAPSIQTEEIEEVAAHIQMEEEAAEGKTLEDEDSEAIEDSSLLEELKSSIGKCLIPGGSKDIEAINAKIESLEYLLEHNPEKMMLLKMVKSLSGYFSMLSLSPEEQTLELMLYIVESMENVGSESSNKSSSAFRQGKTSDKKDVFDVVSKYIEFQNKLIIELSASEKQINAPKNTTSSGYTAETETYLEESFTEQQTLADKEILYEKPNQDDALMEKQMTEPKGFWAKIKRFFGF